ncbi:hypothetical protein A1O1_07774 [Capronia coronata CBS 617.96]|uniref:Zn(2)-C6 fungal-type domain-containing protein n=1 Tax=Capronia coronata CBS 617.96 TaxID=1182541 RepID=W9YHF3_9EURO|nr:uncharacterized protein A1O1_07774 [Capronia coronata CBS 617.96]EXJ81709.1 hypothetical protein A1O1_07774 [Capronia coronata CBS 617.96]
MSEPPNNDRTPPNSGQSCRECRRRKGKCDGKMPVCSICQRYNRHCLYDKHSRSSLTRKHLTEVEERLEKAEALLRTFFSDAELAQMLVHGVSNGVDATTRHSATFPGAVESPSAQPGPVSNAFTAHPALNPSTAGARSLDSSFPPGQEADQKPKFGAMQTSRSLYSDARQSAATPLESHPTAEDDFEWDEREPARDLTNPGGDSRTFEDEIQAGIPNVTDGMATLTVDDSNTGFLGPVSGAALLRLIWMGHSTDGAEDRQYVGTERRKSLEELFKKNQTDYAPSLPWLQTQPLITRAIADNLIDAYFTLYHPTFPILHEPTFREQYSTHNDRPRQGAWHILANLVATLGSFVSTGCLDDTHIILFNAVKTNLTIDSLETGSLSLVQAFAMAANYLQKRNRPNSGYNYGGIALRLAISLGLHKDFHGWQTAPFKKEIRRRVWWSLCVLDVGATVTYGRPLNWPQIGVETAFPLNIHEKDLTPASTVMPPEAEEVTLYTYVRTQSLYHLRTMRIYNRLISSPVPSAAELILLDDELVQGWVTSLPSYYCDRHLPLPKELLLGHAIGRWRFRLLRIIMYRPFLVRWAQDGSGSVKSLASTSQTLTPEIIPTIRCFKAAEECISCIQQFWSTGTHTRLAAWYVL